jgi:hypothetical protein
VGENGTSLTKIQNRNGAPKGDRIHSDGQAGGYQVIGPGYHPLQRSYVKNLEVQDIAAGADVYARIRVVMGEGQADRAEFRRLAGLLFLVLVAEDSAFDPSGETQIRHRSSTGEVRPKGPAPGP